MSTKYVARDGNTTCVLVSTTFLNTGRKIDKSFFFNKLNFVCGSYLGGGKYKWTILYADQHNIRKFPLVFPFKSLLMIAYFLNGVIIFITKTNYFVGYMF